MVASYKKILNQVPADYYERGTRSNLLQFIWHSWKWITLKKMLSGAGGTAGLTRLSVGTFVPLFDIDDFFLHLGVL